MMKVKNFKILKGYILSDATGVIKAIKEKDILKHFSFFKKFEFSFVTRELNGASTLSSKI